MEVLLDVTPHHLVVETALTGAHLMMTKIGLGRPPAMEEDVIERWELPRNSIIRRQNFDKHFLTVLDTKIEHIEDPLSQWARDA